VIIGVPAGTIITKPTATSASAKVQPAERLLPAHGGIAASANKDGPSSIARAGGCGLGPSGSTDDRGTSALPDVSIDRGIAVHESVYFISPPARSSESPCAWRVHSPCQVQRHGSG
jgi:hypothetical protein